MSSMTFFAELLNFSSSLSEPNPTTSEVIATNRSGIESNSVPAWLIMFRVLSDNPGILLADPRPKFNAVTTAIMATLSKSSSPALARAMSVVLYLLVQIILRHNTNFFLNVSY
ncbi:hypothetical protein [Psychrobacter urativorans]|uniref:hypothetical protein n=1 Tax=Psychrobacter urativorans TaxID=45610 RepID=UPI0019180A6C|nr:hypothetical protein [Psychrobacter urativorans]